MLRPGRCSDEGRMGLFGSGRAPGRPGEPFRAIQGAHDTGANPNETRVSFFEVDIFFVFFGESGLLENEPTVPAEQAHTTLRQ